MVHVLLALLLAGPALCQATEANLLANPGFEEGGTGPAGWDLGMEGRGRGSATWLSEGSHAGRRCARTELTTDGDYYMARQRTLAGSALPGHQYRLTGWYRGTQGVHPCAYYLDARGVFLGAWEIGVEPSESWRPFSFVFTTPAGMDHFEVQLRTQGVPGYTCWDDIALMDAEALVKWAGTVEAEARAMEERYPDMLWGVVPTGGHLEAQYLPAAPLKLIWRLYDRAGAADNADHGIIYSEAAGLASPAAGARPITGTPADGGWLEGRVEPAAAGVLNLSARVEGGGDTPLLVVGVGPATTAQRPSLARLGLAPHAGGTGMAREFSARLLPASAERAAQALALGRNAVLRAALGTGGRPAAVVVSAWRNLRSDQWLDWALKGERVTGPVASGARGEYLSAQVLYAPTGQPARLTGVLSDLRGPGGATIPASDCQVRLVDYIELGGEWYPDPLLDQQPFRTPSHGPAVFWVTVRVPEGARPGEYQGSLAMRADGGSEASADLRVRVWDVTMPPTPRLHTSFWLSRAQLNRYFGLKTDVPMADYAPWVNMALEHRLSPVDFVEGPTQPMVRVFRERDGRLTYDFAQWDQYLDLLRKGHANTVHLGFTHWMANYFTGAEPAVIDRKTGKKVALGHAFLSKEHLDALGEYLNAAARHVRQKGFRFVYIQPWDEPGGEGLEKSYQVLKGIKERCPDIPRLMTAVVPATHGGKMAEVVNLWTPLSPSVSDPGFEQMRERGDIMWWYVCCGPGAPYANLFTHWTAAEMRALFWQSRQYEVSGLLYWSMNYWLGWDTPIPPAEKRYPRGPWRSDTGWGDGYFMYPSEKVDHPLSSVRLESIRDGLEDYDLLALLQDTVDANPGADARLVARARTLLKVPAAVSRNLTEFDRDGREMDRARQHAAQIIEALGRTRGVRAAAHGG
jgi:hypothetical protein